MNRRNIAVLACVWTITAGAAHADPRDHHGHRHGHRLHHGPVFDVARVVAVDPVWRRVRVEQPRQRCWTEVAYVESHRGIDRTGAAIAGGVVGAAIGQQVGHGENRAVATVVGAAAGSAIGYQLASRSRDRSVRGYPVERCELVPAHRHERRIDGYRVTYIHGGRRYIERLPYDPGRHVRIRIDGHPVIVG